QLHHYLAVEMEQALENAVATQLGHALHIDDDDDQVEYRDDHAGQADRHGAELRRTPIAVHEDVVRQERNRQAANGTDGHDVRPLHHGDEVAHHREPVD